MIDVGIIAAGDGSRLKAEGIKVSKPMVKINGTPLVLRIIDIVTKNGAKSISCIINENSDDLKEFLQSNSFSPPINTIVKSTESSLHSLFELNKTIDSPFLLTTADSIFLKKEFASFIDFAINKNGADGVFAVTDFIDDEKPLYVSVDENMRIKNFHDENNDFKFVSGGMYFFKKCIKKEVEDAVNSGVFKLRNFQRYLISKGYKLHAYPFSQIIDVDHIADIKKAEKILTNNMELRWDL